MFRGASWLLPLFLLKRVNCLFYMSVNVYYVTGFRWCFYSLSAFFAFWFKAFTFSPFFTSTMRIGLKGSGNSMLTVPSLWESFVWKFWLLPFERLSVKSSFNSQYASERKFCLWLRPFVVQIWAQISQLSFLLFQASLASPFWVGEETIWISGKTPRDGWRGAS